LAEQFTLPLCPIILSGLQRHRAQCLEGELKKPLAYALFLHRFFVSLQRLNIKSMAKNLLNKYVWLVETIYKVKKISFEEINRRWLDNDTGNIRFINILK
jgi:hypothetical protein